MAFSTDNYSLFNGVTNGITNEDSFVIKGDGAKKGIQVWGTFDGAVVTPYNSPDGGSTWIASKDLSGQTAIFTEDIQTSLDKLSQGEQFKLVITGAGASTAIKAQLLQ